MKKDSVRQEYQEKKDKIQWLINQIEHHYRFTSESRLESLREMEEKEAIIENLRQKVHAYQSENSELEQLSSDWEIRNSHLQQQLEEAEQEGQLHAQSIQHIGLKSLKLEDLKQELKKANHRRALSAENVNLAGANNQIIQKRIEENYTKIDKLENEIVNQRERLENTQKQIEALQFTFKSVRELQSCLEKDKSKQTQQITAVSISNAELLAQVTELQANYLQIKKESRNEQACNQSLQQHNLESLPQSNSPKVSLKENLLNNMSDASFNTFNFYQRTETHYNNHGSVLNNNLNTHGFKQESAAEKVIKIETIADIKEEKTSNAISAKGQQQSEKAMSQDKEIETKQLEKINLFLQQSKDASIDQNNSQGNGIITTKMLGSMSRNRQNTPQGIEFTRNSQNMIEQMQQKILEQLNQDKQRNSETIPVRQQNQEDSNLRASQLRATTGLLNESAGRHRLASSLYIPRGSITGQQDSVTQQRSRKYKESKELEKKERSNSLVGNVMLGAGMVATASLLFYSLQSKK